MISSTYILSGVLLLGTAWLFDGGHLSAVTMTVCWAVVLFFASAGASSAYLTVSEVFPMETRALAIAFFYAIGTAAGGISGPLLFSKLVSTGKVGDTVLGVRDRRDPDDRGRSRRGVPRRTSGAAVVGGHRDTADGAGGGGDIGTVRRGRARATTGGLTRRHVRESRHRSRAPVRVGAAVPLRS